MQRHLSYYTHLPSDRGRADLGFAGDPAFWLPEPATLTPEGWMVDLHAEGVLPPPLAVQRAEAQVSPASEQMGELLRSISWHAARADRLFPVFAGELQLIPLPVSGWQLSLEGTYRPPLSVVGGAADRLLGQRVAQACLRRFVLDVAQRLTAVTLPV